MPSPQETQNSGFRLQEEGINLASDKSRVPKDAAKDPPVEIFRSRLDARGIHPSTAQ